MIECKYCRMWNNTGESGCQYCGAPLDYSAAREINKSVGLFRRITNSTNTEIPYLHDPNRIYSIGELVEYLL